MRIWVDLATSPQVVFFRPILEQLVARGHEILITAQDYEETIALMERYGLKGERIGRHGGHGMAEKAVASLERTRQLVRWARQRRPIGLAVSHNSYTQALAARLVGIPTVNLMDYEHQPMNHLSFRLASRVIVPECFPEEVVTRCGAIKKTFRYPGFKEQVYLSDFSPWENYLNEFQLPTDRVMIAMRPPATWTMYNWSVKKPLFDVLLPQLAKRDDTFIILLPRVPEQGDTVRRLGYPNVWIPPKALDGPTLVCAADMVISAGGTMNREAAVLGTPAYTVFMGKSAAVDRELMRLGRMVAIEGASDIPKIRVEKKDHTQPLRNRSLAKSVTDLILQR
jgi:predicted glycosyltransferase